MTEYHSINVRLSDFELISKFPSKNCDLNTFKTIIRHNRY